MQFLEIEWQSELYQKEVDLRHRLLRAPLGLGFSEDELQEESGQLHFGMVDDQALIACTVIVPLSATDAKLRQMAVDDSHQGQGVGTRLVRHVESALHRRGFRRILLHARDTAVGFYEAIGYRRQGSVFTEVTIPHWKMTKSITEGP